MIEIRLTIDDREAKIPKGSTILEAARKAGSYVPALCDHLDLKPIGSCKLCIVSVEGQDCYPTACSTLAEEGMVVHTRTEELQEMRRHTQEMLLALTNHPNCTARPKYQCFDFAASREIQKDPISREAGKLRRAISRSQRRTILS